MKILNLSQMKGIPKGITKGFKNAYVCQNLHHVITVNTNDGFVPDRIVCPQCDTDSYSMSFLINQEFPAVIEFYKPSEAEMQAAELRMTEGQAKAHRDYINKGGLISKPIKKESLTGK